MERNIKSLINYKISATDGTIGEIEDFYFDDKSWKIRYLIVKTGNWLTERKVLIAPDVLIKQTWADALLRVKLTKNQIKNSPDIDTEKPVSRQKEIELYRHYQWENYWGSGFYGQGSLGLDTPFPVLDQKGLIEPNENNKPTGDNVHLRSEERITGYHTDATDGMIGHVHDFIIDDQTWQIKFFVIDTHNWFGSKKVLISIAQVEEINWNENEVYLNITTAAVENSAPFVEADFKHFQEMNYER